jgi:hypothetical protein
MSIQQSQKYFIAAPVGWAMPHDAYYKEHYRNDQIPIIYLRWHCTRVSYEVSLSKIVELPSYHIEYAKKENTLSGNF